MLGRLLSTAASTLNPASYGSRNAAHLESVTEEEHTSGLLFPDASLLRRSNAHAYPLQTSFSSPNASTAGAYDDRGGLELDAGKDFRVVIAQNALGDRDEPCILLDTRMNADQPPQGLGLDPHVFDGPSRRHSRTASLTKPPPRRASVQTTGVHQSSLAESSPLAMAANARRSGQLSPGAFNRVRGRSSTLSAAVSGPESYHNRHAGDSSEYGLLNCIFGSSAFSYRGSSTKIHILSADGDTANNSPSASPSQRGSDNHGPRGTTPRGPLGRAHTVGMQPGPTSLQDKLNDPKPPSKVIVLITRMFSVNLPDARDGSLDGPEFTSPFQESLPDGYPFPDVSKRKKIKEKKTPMYAVAISIQIPLGARHGTRPISRLGGQTADPLRPGGMSFSLDSAHGFGGSFLEETLSPPPASLDERIDLLVDHWDTITRTLSHLERLAGREILSLLKQFDALSSLQPKPAKAPNMQRTNQTIVQLPPNVLAGNKSLREEAVLSSQRICFALRIPRVVTGQSRWGVWREEARWIARGLGDKEHNFFFLVLITSFLGNHTEWLSSLGPDWYRRRHYQQQKAQQDAEPIISNRTVIVCPDKMTARRLIFLLSAFLPARQRFEPPASPFRPGSSTNPRPLSQSPPSVPQLRQESLRRTIERRARAQRLNLDDGDSHERSISVSSSETAHRSSDDVDSVAVVDYPKSRRESDARSIRTMNLPMHANDTRMRKATASTASTMAPNSTVPVAHFASQQNRRVPGRRERSESDETDSLASANLLRNLQRSESSNISSDSSNPAGGRRWSGMFSGLWGSRQGSSATDDTEINTPSTAERRPSAVLPGKSQMSKPTLSQMAQEVAITDEQPQKEITASNKITIPSSSAAPKGLDENSQELLSPSTERNRESPLKLSVRSQDGVVDVDLPLPGFVSLSSSGDSTLASPKKTRTSVTSVDAVASTHSSNSGFNVPIRENDGPNTNVAGWLKSFHEDFLLQAVRPYDSLETDVKRAMLSEPTPNPLPGSTDIDGAERWIDVATTLIADTRTFSVKRLRLRRKIQGNGTPLRTPTSPLSNSRPITPRQRPETPSSTTPFTSLFTNAGRSRKDSVATMIDPAAINEAEEKFVEEPVMDLDGILVDAVERVLARSGQSSVVPTRPPSPSRGRKEDTSDAHSIHGEIPTVEVPRAECRKMVLGALEEVVRSVTAERFREDGDPELSHPVPSADREQKKKLAAVDNTLREGVRKWLLDVEEAV
ncbi:hypothetical protein Plec18167_008227 [Paecilomyces lecythidis]|uniref:Folliculin-interacting protein N-terminal domain-containing protein n=1 Tax=Paecilomyces lecythidis TaxID=3004212 RepID=A0ABR3WZ20_9EURO